MLSHKIFRKSGLIYSILKQANHENRQAAKKVRLEMGCEL